MNPKQKVLFTQLQIAGAGLIIGVFGFMFGKPIFVWIGIAIVLVGAIRIFLVSKLLDNEEVSQEDIAEYNRSFIKDEDDESDF